MLLPSESALPPWRPGFKPCAESLFSDAVVTSCTRLALSREFQAAEKAPLARIRAVEPTKELLIMCVGGEGDLDDVDFDRAVTRMILAAAFATFSSVSGLGPAFSALASARWSFSMASRAARWSCRGTRHLRGRLHHQTVMAQRPLPPPCRREAEFRDLCHSCSPAEQVEHASIPGYLDMVCPALQS